MGLLLTTLIITYFSFLFVRKVPHVGRDYFDFGLIFITPVLLMLCYLAAAYAIDIDLTQFKKWDLFTDKENVSDMIYLYLFYVLIYSISYCILANYKSSARVKIDFKLNKSFIFISYILLSVLFFTFFASSSSNIDFSSIGGFYGQLKNIFSRFYLVSSALFFFIIFINYKDPRKAFYMLVAFIMLFTIISFIYTHSRGSLVMIIIAASLLDTIRWRGSIITKIDFITLILGGAFIFSLFNFVEAWYLGSFNYYFFMQLYEYRPIQTTLEIVQSVDNGDIPLRYGSTYMDSIVGLIPSQIRPYEIQPLSIFYAKTFYLDAYNIGWAAAFSGVAEGYMNFKYAGVAIQAFIYAFISVIIRNVRYSYGVFGAIFYSISLPLAYKMTRGDLSYVVHNIFWSVIVVFLFLLFYKIIKNIKC